MIESTSGRTRTLHNRPLVIEYPCTSRGNVLVTDFVPSEMACFANSPGRIRRTAVWISREEMVDFFEYEESSAQYWLGMPYKHEGNFTRTRCLRRDTLEDIVDERVENGHCLVGDTSVRVDLLEDYPATTS